jgi:O-antigen ligase
MAVVVIMMLFLPFTQRYVEKFEAGIQGEDVETQMRFGEYKDAATLIGLYPVMGVGFSGVPKIDLYLGVANTYLTIASHAGIVGLIGYLILMLSPFIYSFRHYAAITSHEGITDIWLGLSAGLVGVMVGGIFDHFYFKIDQFQATMTLVWIIMGLMLASVRLAVEEDNSAGRFNG